MSNLKTIFKYILVLFYLAVSNVNVKANGTEYDVRKNNFILSTSQRIGDNVNVTKETEAELVLVPFSGLLSGVGYKKTEVPKIINNIYDFLRSSEKIEAKINKPVKVEYAPSLPLLPPKDKPPKQKPSFFGGANTFHEVPQRQPNPQRGLKPLVSLLPQPIRPIILMIYNVIKIIISVPFALFLTVWSISKELLMKSLIAIGQKVVAFTIKTVTKFILNNKI